MKISVSFEFFIGGKMSEKKEELKWTKKWILSSFFGMEWKVIKWIFHSIKLIRQFIISQESGKVEANEE
jgi:hypothetical protein